MYVGLSVRDECERSMKNQVSKVESMDFATGLRVASEKQPAKRPHVQHDWKIKSRARLSFSQLSRKKSQPAKDPRKFLFGKKLCFALLSLYPHYIYSHYSQIVMSAFQRENPRKYT